MWIIFLIATSLTFLLGYRSLLHGAKPIRIVMERETKAGRLSSSQAKDNYDPYFNRVNFTPIIAGVLKMQ